jgi:uncharacterized SAM-binding protein YcdF (DUF218 family)
MLPIDQRSDDELARILWDYNRLETPLAQSDAILVLGSNDLRVAERGAELYLQRYAPLIIFSGGFGALTQGLFTNPEAQVFADIAVSLGVPASQILIENQSTNTGENIILTQKVVEEKGIPVKNLILVQKPYMLRRAYATLLKQWPGIGVSVTGPQISYENYPNGVISKALLINIMVGDTQRIRLYPELGFQVAQDMPTEVWSAFEELVKRGYVQRLV